MIKSVSGKYVTFEWEDGETHTLTIDEYKEFMKKHDPFEMTDEDYNKILEELVKDFKSK